MIPRFIKPLFNTIDLKEDIVSNNLHEFPSTTFFSETSYEFLFNNVPARGIVEICTILIGLLIRRKVQCILVYDNGKAKMYFISLQFNVFQ